MRVRSLATVTLLAASLTGMPAASASSETTLSGVLDVLHSDDFGRGVAVHGYTLHGDDGRDTVLRFGDEGPHQLGGQKVRVHGTKRGSTLDVGSASDAQATGAPSSTAAAPAASTPTTFGIVLLQFKDKPLPATVTPDKVSQLLFGSPGTVSDFYADSSYGNLLMTGTVFPVVTINALATDACANRAWGDEARAALASNGSGFNDASFTQVAHIMPRSTCNFLGTSELPGKYTWDITDGIEPNPASERAFRGLVEHEFGHNLNAYHGASLTCTDTRGKSVTLGSKCTKKEYGDPFTVMGDHRGERSFNAFQKGRVTWYAPAQGRNPWLASTSTLTVTSTQQVTLAPLDSFSQAPQVLRVPRPGSRTGEYYYVEYRSGAGYDGAQLDNPAVSGVTLRLAPDYATGISTSLLDMTPQTAGDFTDAQLVPGASYTDGALTISLPAGGPPGVIQVTFAAATKGGK